MRHGRLATALFGLAASACLLVGCQTASSSRVTVMNESDAAVLVDISSIDPPRAFVENEALEAGAVRAFTLEHAGESNPLVQVGVRPASSPRMPAQLIEFATPGPYLLRIQGTSANLRFIASRDSADVGVREIRDPNAGRLGAEPPVNPSRR